MNFIATIDVEEWFQVENLRPIFPHDKWPYASSRLENSVDRILALLSTYKAQATFFVLGWCAERNPAIVKRISEEGHEVACHGYNHEMLTGLPPARIREDISRSKQLLEDITGKEVKGYRAPCFSITDETFEILAELGFEYDSSLFPAAYHDRYGNVDRKALTQIDRALHRHENGIFEAMLPVVSLLGLNVPWAGGGYFRLMPPGIFNAGIDHRMKKDSRYIFYMHPWEIDPDQPRVDGIGRLNAFRHYLNLGLTYGRLETLLRRYGSMRLIDCLPGKEHCIQPQVD